MDLRKLSDRLVRWMSSATVSSAEQWETLAESVEAELRVVLIEDAGPPQKPIAQDADFTSEGRALFAELSKLTDSPLVARRLRHAMEAFGRTVVPSFHLRSGPALSVIPGGARPEERPSERYIDDSADDAPRAG